jgi:asparagine synthase (glutamine-hydrolysing)
MCGIAGFFSDNHTDELIDSLSKVNETLSHRGPNDSGLYVEKENGLGLAHRRLSILDLTAAGRQPMKTEDGSVYIVYNGEVYNYRSIRTELQSHGFSFESDCDTEVILKAYQKWGTDCLKRFSGMFAFAIWDRNKCRLFLARDRLGIKPLYYHVSNGMFIFGSELKALMAFGRFPKHIDEEALALYLHYQYVPAPRTIFQNTRMLLPGHFLLYENRELKTVRYWRLRLPEGTDREKLTETEAIDQLDNQLLRSVKDRLISDVPLGALLSGGIDSSIVVAMMQRVAGTGNPPRTFSIGFREKGYDEAPHALRIAQYLGTRHTELYVTPSEALDVIPALPEIYDEPFADSSAIPTYLVSRLSRTRVTVALSGDGGDEQFCGYTRYWGVRSLETFNRSVPDFFRRLISGTLKRVPPKFAKNAYELLQPVIPQRLNVKNFPDKWDKLTRLFSREDIAELYRMAVSLWPPEDLSRLLLDKSLVENGLPVTRYEKTFETTKGHSTLTRLMAVDRNTYLPDAMLTKVDRASMANGLEVRVPLLDHRLVQFVASLPDHMKYRNGTGKYLLKKLLGRYLPPELFERPKMGFGVPIDKWLQNELKEMLRDYLSTDRIKREGRFDNRCIQKTIEEHVSGERKHQYRLWGLLMWQMWRERWLS